jgi:hypothetical protein
MIVAGATRTNGPKSVKNGVHIIFVEAEPSTCHNPDGSTSDASLDEAAKLVTWAQPTDVVVFDRKPWHYVNNKLRAHPKVHDDYPETILELSISHGDRAVWFSEVRFDITKIELRQPRRTRSALRSSRTRRSTGMDIRSGWRDPPFPCRSR